MAAYVDALRACSRTSSWPFMASSHLLADTVDELHAFANRIGLKRAWYQPLSHPHYDLNARRHAVALSNGAILVDRHRLVSIIQRQRSERNTTP